MPTPQAYLAVHQSAELAVQLKSQKEQELERIKRLRQERIEQEKLAKRL